MLRSVSSVEIFTNVFLFIFLLKNVRIYGYIYRKLVNKFSSLIFLCFPYVSSDCTLRLFHLLFINLQTKFTRFSSKQWCSWNDDILFFENNSIVYWQKWIDNEATWFLSWDYLFRDPWFDTSFGVRDEMWYSIRETWYTIYIREMQGLDLATNKFWLAAWKASLQFG